jgi:hypothetical protein
MVVKHENFQLNPGYQGLLKLIAKLIKALFPCEKSLYPLIDSVGKRFFIKGNAK